MYVDSLTSFSPDHIYPPSDYEIKRDRIEKRKEKLQKRLEDLELTVAALDGKVMQYNLKLDEIKNRIYLASYQPHREKLDKEYERLTELRDSAYAKYLDAKSLVATLNYYLEELDVELDSLVELAEVREETDSNHVN